MAMSTRFIFPHCFISSPPTKPGCKLQTRNFHPISGISHSSISKLTNRTRCPVNQSSRFFSNGRRVWTDNVSKRDLVVHCGILPGTPLPTPDSWQGWVLGAVIALIIPFFSHKWGPLFKFTKQVEEVVDTIEHVTEVVESVAGQVEKVADEIGDQFQEGGKLREAFDFIENAAHKTAQAAHLADEIIDKVEEVEKTVEEFMEPVKEETNEKMI